MCVLTAPPTGHCCLSPSLSSVQFSSVTQSCQTLCDPMNRSTPGLPAHHPLPEFTQTHVHRVGDAIRPSHPLSSPSPPALNPSQHQGLFRPPHFLSHDNFEIRLINNPTMAFRHSGKMKSHMSLTLNLKLEIIMLNKECMSKTEIGWKLGLLHQTFKPSYECKGKVPAGN